MSDKNSGKAPVLILCAALMVFLATQGSADVRVPHIFGSNMVLQRGMPVPVWGWAEPGEAITVSFGDAAEKTTADAKGEWKVALPPQKAGEARTLTVAGKNTITLDNVLVGEVWFCSGQSNMDMGVLMCNDADKEVQDANYPNIRLLCVNHVVSGIPNLDCDVEWKVCSPDTIKQGVWEGFSAAAYYFGREIHKKLGVPVGLIQSAWGGTRVEPWIPPVGFAEAPELKDLSAFIDKANQQYAEAMKPLFPEFQEWLTASEQAAAQGKPLPPRFPFPHHPIEPDVYGGHPDRPTVLFNSMVNPFLPFAIRGALWYQGESNLDDPLYGEKMKALINGWRTVWGEGEFPFYFVQIAPYEGYGDKDCKNYGADALPMLWQEQLSVLSVPNTGMIGTYDITDLKDIHPKDKQDVGKRLALLALAKTYGQDVVCSGPVYKSMEVKDGTIVLHFDDVGGGLVARDGKDLSWFTIAGEDKQFVPAKAKIIGDTVVVSSEKVAKPAAVRFGWSKVAEPNLSNKDGLPALPFRTDEW